MQLLLPFMTTQASVNKHEGLMARLCAIHQHALAIHPSPHLTALWDRRSELALGLIAMANRAVLEDTVVHCAGIRAAEAVADPTKRPLHLQAYFLTLAELQPRDTSVCLRPTSTSGTCQTFYRAHVLFRLEDYVGADQEMDDPHAASHFTCLDIKEAPYFFDQRNTSKLIRQLRPLLKDNLLPNLAELYLSSGAQRNADASTWRDFAEVETQLSSFLAALVGLRSLRVLHVQGACVELCRKNFLLNAEFPPQFEVLRWNNQQNVFRFVTDTPDGVPLFTPGGGKRGRLQCLPAVARTHLTRAGVWESPPPLIRADTVYDHSGPTISLTAEAVLPRRA